MNNAMQFDFSVNKEAKTISVKRAFAAPLQKVWSCWTESALLDQWWAPKPYHVETKSMDFSVGGYWLYAMVSPDGVKQWCRADFKSIEPLKSYSALDAFCDETGIKIHQDFPRSLWTNTFSEAGDTTLVSIVISYDELADLEKIMQMGFKEGFTAGLENLDALLRG